MSVLHIDTAGSDRYDFADKDPLSKTQAHMVRLAFLLVDEDGNTIEEACHLIKLPEGAHVTQGAQGFHGISDSVLAERGMSLAGVMMTFANTVGVARRIVAHSWQYRRHELDRSLALVGMPAREWPDPFCIAIKGAQAVGIERRQPGGGFAFPSFDQCCDHFLGKRLVASYDPVYDGLARVRAVRVFYEKIVVS